MKRLISLLLTCFLLLSAIETSVLATSASGSCGENVTWALDESTGVLTVSGNGAMDDYQMKDSGGETGWNFYSTAPWWNYRHQIRQVVIENGVTHVGNHAFASYDNYEDENCLYDKLQSVSIAGSVTSIGDYAFSLSTALTELRLSDGLRSIGNNAFWECYNLSSYTIPNTVISIGDFAFQQTSEVTSVTIPRSVQKIGKCAIGYTFSQYEDPPPKVDGFTIAGYVGTAGETYAKDNGFSFTAIKDGTDEGTVSQRPDWSEAYRKFVLSEAYLSTEATYFPNGQQTSYDVVDFALHDFEDDGIPELITSNGNGDFYLREYFVYAYRDSAITYLGRMAHQATELILAPNTKYNGIFSQGDRKGYYTGLYASVDDGSLHEEQILLVEKVADNDNVSYKEKQIAEDHALYELFSGYFFGDTLKEGLMKLQTYTMDEILEMGWDAFIGMYSHSTGPVTESAIYNKGTPVAVLDKSFEEYVFQTYSTTYNPDLSYYLCALSRAVYSVSDITKSLDSLGFATEKSKGRKTEYIDSNPSAYAFAQKELPDGSSLVLVVIRGSNNLASWISNFTLGKRADGETRYHEGFSEIASEYHDALKEFLNGIPTKDVTYVVTDHSLGAAVANLMTNNLLSDGVPTSRIYNYNFACPDVATGPDTWTTEQNCNIFNIGNCKDLVSFLPGLAGSITATDNTAWGKFGRSFWFSKDWSKASESSFNILDAFTAHDAEEYLTYLSRREDLKAFKTREEVGMKSQTRNPVLYTVLTTFCPVDVTISDQTQTLVASIIQGKAKNYSSKFGEVIVITIDDKKVIYLPQESKFDVSITATDKGKMIFGVYDADPFFGEIQNSKIFTSVELTEGKQMTSSVGGEIEASDVKLYVVNNTGDAITEVREDGTEVPIKQNTIFKPLIISIGVLIIMGVIVCFLWQRQTQNKER